MKKHESIRNEKSLAVATKEQAWRKANELAGFDFSLDEESTATAGYPIYAADNKRERSYIADLGNTIEINYIDESYCESFHIRINADALEADRDEWKKEAGQWERFYLEAIAELNLYKAGLA